MFKFLSDFLFGLAFGCGFLVAQAVLSFVAGLLSGGAHVPIAGHH